MGLKIIIGRDGKPCSMWYGRICSKGKKKDINLGVPIAGTFPMSADGRPILTAEGDEAFERSRRQAEKAFARAMREKRKEKSDLAAQVYEKRTGQKVEGVALDDMGEKWIKAQWKTENEGWRNAERKWFDGFVRFARREATRLGKPCDGVMDITEDIIEAWIKSLEGKYSRATLRRQVQLMGAAFDACVGNRRGKGKNRDTSIEVVANPFISVSKRTLGKAKDDADKMIHRVPLTEDQLARLFELTSEDPKIYPLVVCAACTGFRIGDVCNLKWEDVDLDIGEITLTMAKTGGEVTVMILPRLREVLESAKTVEANGSTPSPYVFPAAQAWYARNPDGLYRYAKPYFARAVFGDDPAEVVEVTDDGADGEAAALPPPDAEAVGTADGETPNGAARLSAVRDIEEALAEARFTDEKKEKILEVYRRFKSGVRSFEIATALGLKRSQVSMYLADAERLTGERLRPLAKSGNRKPSKEDLARKTRQGRDAGRHAASLYGWHSLRATFVVLAAKSGVPLADVQKLVGHTTIRTTLRHYYNPTKLHAAKDAERTIKASGSILTSRLDGKTDAQALPPPTATAATPTSAKDLKALVERMTEDERSDLFRTLLGA